MPKPHGGSPPGEGSKFVAFKKKLVGKGAGSPGGLAAFLSKKKLGAKKPSAHATGAGMFKGIRP